MGLSRILAVHTYTSAYGNQTYTFDVTLDSNNIVSVRNLRSPFGLITDSMTSLPDQVVSDINTARGIMRQQVAETQVSAGTMTWTGQTSQTVNITAGVLNNTAYRVVYTTPDGTILTTSNQTPTSFLVTAPSAYGSAGTPYSVTYVVLVASQQASSLSGTLTFNSTTGPSQAVAFSTALLTSTYRVVLTPSAFFFAEVINQSTTGFTVALSYTPATGETVTVGYDVFI